MIACRGPRCRRLAPTPIEVGDRWIMLCLGGRSWRACSARCAADVVEQLAARGLLDQVPDPVEAAAATP